MRIGELARLTGISQRMLRYYELQGLLGPARTEAGYRDYGQAELDAARRIRLLSASGLRLDAIRVLLPCMVDDAGRFESCDEIRETLRHELQGLNLKIRNLTDSRRIVKAYLDALDEPADPI